MNLKLIGLILVVATSVMVPVQADAQTRAHGTAETACSPSSLQESIQTALMRISSSPDANAMLMDAVKARHDRAIRVMLIENGVDESKLAPIAIDANGSAAGPRKADAHTIYFTIANNNGSPLGLVYMGHPYGWVDWNTFDPWAYFFD